MSEKKPSNPKDVIGSSKIPLSVIPPQVMIAAIGVSFWSVVPLKILCEIAHGLGEGAIKYGKHNYRVEGVRASIYYDATMRHILDWLNGISVDPDSGVDHLSKAICSTIVLRDSMLQNLCTDDRPPASEHFMPPLNISHEFNCDAHGYWERYTYLNILWYKCYFINGKDTGYEEYYQNYTKIIIRFHL